MLYIVATPIGNLKDITLRALDVLKSADFIMCEDTRHSIKLLNHYGIKKPLLSCHQHNERESAEKAAALLKEGKNIALISDAGTPCISDPGSVLLKTIREEGLEFTVIPGATAFVPALILSGFTAPFTFIGFIPEKKGERDKLLSSFKDSPASLIFYSAPHDVERDVKRLYEAFGNRRAAAVKEITKIYERSIGFKLNEGFLEEAKGEYVLIVEGVKPAMKTLDDAVGLVKEYLGEGISKNEAVKRAAKECGIPKNELYAKFVND